MNKLLWVVAGGGLGSGARYLAALGAVRWLGPTLPYGTFAVNVLGSLLLGLLLRRFTDDPGGSEGLRLAVTTGFMGGFTTYSTFNYETLRLVEGGAYGTAALYATLTLLVCLGAGALGIMAAGWL